MICGQGVEQALAEWSCGPTLVLGVGNTLRGDDAVGPMVCSRLASGRAVDCGDAPERYLGLAGDEGIERVLMVDAMDFGGGVGELAFCRLSDLTERFGTTHTSGLAVLIRFIEEEYGKPVAVLGVQPADTRFGARVHAAVQEAVDRVSELLRGAISGRETGEMEAAWTRS